MNTRARTIEDKLLRRQLILKSAKKIFFDKGYQRATIELITEGAGLSTGTFYLYFKSKQEVYRILYSDGIDIFHRMAEEAVSWPDMDAIAKLSAIAHTYYRFYTEHTEYFDILAFIHLHQDALHEPDEMTSILDQKALDLLRMIESIIEEGVASGELASMDTWKATNVLWGMMDGLVMLAERNNVMVIGVSLEELIKQSLEMMFYGMTRRIDAGPDSGTKENA